MKSKSTRTARPHLATIRTVLALVGAMLLLGLAPASAALAYEPAAATAAAADSGLLPTAGSLLTAIDNDGAGGATAGSDSKFLAINRWANATGSLHTKTNPLDPAGQIATATRVNTQSLGLTAISGLWTGTAALSDLSANLQPIQSAGVQVDRGAAALGQVILANPLIFLLAGMIAIVAAIWNKSRGRDSTGLIKQVLGVVAVFALIGVMSAGAANSTPKMGDTTSKYVPGVGSPGWVVTTLTTTIGAATDGALAGISNVDLTTTLNGDAASAAGELNCSNYTVALTNYFAENKKSGTASMASISRMWQTSGASVWANVQFGVDNKFRDKVWCHQADHDAGVGTTQQREFSTKGVTGGATLFSQSNPASKAWTTTNNNDADKTMIAWAACDWNVTGWAVEPEFKTKLDGSEWIKASSCKSWWEGDQKTNLDFDGHGFNIGTGEPGPQQIHELSDNEGVLNFMRAWQGTENGVGGSILIVWAILSGLIIFIVLGVVLSGAVVVAKVLAIVSMATVILILVGSLFTRSGPGPKIVALLKKVFGYTLLAAASSAIVMLVTWLTQTMMALGNSLFSAPGSAIGLIWTGASPILALIALHMLFKSFKLPSPITAKGALAWGAAGGAAGAAIGGGIANRLAGRAGEKAMGAAKGAGSAAVNKMTGGKIGQPIGAGGKTREAAGAPPVAGAIPTEAGKAAKKEIAEAREFARGNGQAVPQTATERMNARLTAAAGNVPDAGKRAAAGAALVGGALNAASAAKNGATAIVDGRAAQGVKIAAGRADDALTKAANIDVGEVARRAGDAFHAGVDRGEAGIRQGVTAVKVGAGAAIVAAKENLALSRTKEGRAVLAANRIVRQEKRAAVDTAAAKTTPIAKGASAVAGAVSSKLTEQKAKIAANPAGALWQARKPAGTVALHGIAAVATGGLSLPLSAVAAARGGVKKKRQAASHVDNQMIQALRAHKKIQADTASKASEGLTTGGAAAGVVPAVAPTPAMPALPNASSGE
jgi:uncharacterized membrane protein HdeD (DUF308 family)